MIAGATLGLVGVPIADLLVGQDERAARIEVACTAACSGALTEDGLLIDGVRDEMSVALTGGPLTAIRLEAEGNALTRLRWTTDADVTDAQMLPCGAARACVVVRFAGLSLRDRLAEASGDDLAAGACDVARAALDRDPWDTTALRRTAQCRAAGGAVGEGAALLERLLRVTDDPAAARTQAVLAGALEGDRTGG